MALLTGSVVEFKKELGRFEVKGIGNIAPGTKFITVMKSKETGEKPKKILMDYS